MSLVDVDEVKAKQAKLAAKRAAERANPSELPVKDKPVAGQTFDFRSGLKGLNAPKPWVTDQKKREKNKYLKYKHKYITLKNQLFV
jgi:hypothetical protein